MMRFFKINLTLGCLAQVYLVLAIMQGSIQGQEVAASSADSSAAVCMTPDHKLLSASDRGLFLLDAQSLEVLRQIECRLEKIYSIKFSPTGKSVAIAGGTPAEVGAICVLSFPTFELLHYFECYDDVATDVDWLDGFTLVSCSMTGSCCRIDLNDETQLKSKPVHSSGVLAIEALDEGRVVSAGQDNAIRVWVSVLNNGPEQIRSLNNHTAQVNDLDVNHVGPKDASIMVVSASDDFTIRFWQPTIGRMVRFARLESIPNCVIWDRTGDLAIAGCRNGRVYQIEKNTARIIRSIETHVGWINGLAISADGDRLVVAGVDGMVVIVIR